MKRRWFLASILPVGLTALVLARRTPSPPADFSRFDPPNPEIQEIFLPDTKANRALYAALSKNNLAGVKQAFAQGASGNAKLTWKTEGYPPEQQQAASPFVTLVQSRELNESDKAQAILIFREFLAHDVDIHATSAERVSAIHAATLLGSIDLVKETLARGADINAPSKTGGTPLMIAIMPILRDKEGSEVPLIQFLLEHGANPNVFHSLTGTTPLMQVAIANHPKTAALLLKHGADPALVNKPGMGIGGRKTTALELAQSAGSEEVARVIRAAHPNMTAFEAAQSGNLAALKKHLDKGVDPNRRNENGSPLLFLAAQSGSVEAVTLLLERGADPNAATQPHGLGEMPPEPGTRGFTPLHTASVRGFVAIMRLLLDRQADVNALAGRADFPETPLTQAIQGNEGAAVKLLLERGAKMGNALERCLQNAGRMPLRRRGESPTQRRSQDTVLEEQNQIYALLIARTRDPKALGQALCLALEKGQYEVAEDLLKRGADVNVKSYQGEPLLFLHILQIALIPLTAMEMKELTAKEQRERRQEDASELRAALKMLDMILARKPNLAATIPGESDWRGGTALAYARYLKLPDVAARLQKAGLKR